jgi:hypothetical protein
MRRKMCIYKCMLNVHKNQQSRQTGSRNLMGPKTLSMIGVPIWSLWPNIRFLSNYWWQESDIGSQASYRYAILWEAFLDPSDSYFLFADLVGFYTHWTYMHIFRHIFLSNCWWQKSDFWSQASYRYIILWVAFLDPSDSYFLFADRFLTSIVAEKNAHIQMYVKCA